MRHLKSTMFLLALVTMVAGSKEMKAQGLEDVIVETYYISDADDATDATGGFLEAGSTTYRIFIDMAPGYELQAVYGNENHDAFINSTTRFFNNADRGETTGDQIGDNRLDENTVALDSYVTIGAASDAHVAVLKSEDTDGSIVGGANNDGGSAGIPGGLLKNADAAAGIPLTTADGLLPNPVVGPSVGTSPTLDLSMLNNANSPQNFFTDGDTWFEADGVQGPTATNRVMIAQITTNGELSFELNVQLGSPDGQVERYVARDAQTDETEFPGLTFPAACQAPTDLQVVEIAFGNPNPRVNGTWTNPEGTTDCEVRGGRIQPASVGTANPVFANINNTRIITQTDGSTILFNIVLYNNPNVPFVIGQTYGFEARCQCSDGSGFSDWSGIGVNTLFQVPVPPPSIETASADFYPNPVSRNGELNINLFNVESDVVTMEILDMTGRVVRSEQATVSGGAVIQRMALGGSMNQGQYFLRIIAGDQVVTERFVVTG